MPYRLLILRCLASVLLLLQLALPYAQAHAAANGADLSQLVCNPSGKPVSEDGLNALSELMDALGGSTEHSPDDSSIGDCERCVTPSVTLPIATILPPDSPRYERISDGPKPTLILADSAPRGPPCGRRAPPLFG